MGNFLGLGCGEGTTCYLCGPLWPVRLGVRTPGFILVAGVQIPYGLQTRKAPNWVPFLRLERAWLAHKQKRKTQKRPPPLAAGLSNLVQRAPSRVHRPGG